MRALFFAVVVCGLVGFGVRADDACTSGTPVGKRPGPYSFLIATGPERGKPTCLICEQLDKPAVIIFTRSLSEPVGALLQELDAQTAKHSASGFKVWLTQLSETADLDSLAKFAQTHGIKSSPVGVFEDLDGPPSYRLNREAEVTVLVFVNQKVVFNAALRADKLTDAQRAKIVAAVPGAVAAYELPKAVKP